MMQRCRRRRDLSPPNTFEPRADPIEPWPSKNARLPRVDAIVMMDTDAEAMGDVFTPGRYFKSRWYTYARDFDSYKGQFGSQSATWEAPYLGKYFVVSVNGDLPHEEQVSCAQFYYDEYGYWTTVMGGITSWAVLAGSATRDERRLSAHLWPSSSSAMPIATGTSSVG